MWEKYSGEPKECSDLKLIGQTGSFKDPRDNTTYGIVRLKDNQCWMTSNLRIGSNTSTTLLTPSNSDLSSSYTLPQGGTSGFSDTAVASIYINSSSSYGGYYNFHAVTGGTDDGVNNSICPKGWRLPSLREYVALIDDYGYNPSSSPLNLSLIGYYLTGTLNTQSSTFYMTNSAGTYIEYQRSQYYTGWLQAYAQSYRIGVPVRCVSKS